MPQVAPAPSAPRPGRPPRGSCAFRSQEGAPGDPRPRLPPTSGTGTGPRRGSPPCGLGTRPRKRSPPRSAAPAAPPDPRSSPPTPLCVPEPLPAPSARSRPPARHKAGGGAARYLGERRVPRGDGRSRPGAEQRGGSAGGPSSWLAAAPAAGPPRGGAGNRHRRARPPVTWPRAPPRDRETMNPPGGPLLPVSAGCGWGAKGCWGRIPAKLARSFTPAFTHSFSHARVHPALGLRALGNPNLPARLQLTI